MIQKKELHDLISSKISGEKVTIRTQIPTPVKFEQSFKGHFPTDKLWIGKNLENEYEFDFEGNGFVLKGETYPKKSNAWESRDPKKLKMEVLRSLVVNQAKRSLGLCMQNVTMLICNNILKKKRWKSLKQAATKVST